MTLYLLYKQIGVSFLSGVIFAIVLIPINKIIANQIGKFSTKLMEYKDQRVRLIGETLRGIISIKLNVWEDHFLRNILSSYIIKKCDFIFNHLFTCMTCNVFFSFFV